MDLDHLHRGDVVVTHLPRSVEAAHQVVQRVQRCPVQLVEKHHSRLLDVLEELRRLEDRLAVLDAVHAQKGRHRVRHRSHVVLAAADAQLAAGEHHQFRLSRSRRARQQEVVVVVDEGHRHLPASGVDCEPVLPDGRCGPFLLGAYPLQEGLPRGHGEEVLLGLRLLRLYAAPVGGPVCVPLGEHLRIGLQLVSRNSYRRYPAYGSHEGSQPVTAGAAAALPHLE